MTIPFALKIRTQLLLLAFIALSFAYSEGASAEVIRGIVQRRVPGGDVYLTTKDQTGPIRIVPVGLPLLADLARLKDGDFVVGSGWMQIGDSGEKTVRLESIESVGLQDVLGIWKSERWEVFEFRDFNRLNLYVATTDPVRPMTLAKTRELNYVLAPARGTSYSIFMSDDRSIVVGSIEVEDGKKLNMVVFDSTTGSVSETISLSPLPLQ